MMKQKNEGGYNSLLYAQTLKAYGAPIHLPHSQGYLLERPILNSPHIDATNPYPLYICQDWSQLNKDIQSLAPRWVSLSLVTDPFGNFSPNDLQTCFPDQYLLFKEHYIIDLNQHPDTISSHHRRNARKGLKQCQIEKVDQPLHYLEEWQNCLNTLIKKHELTGINAYHQVSFDTLFEMPDLLIFRAYNKTESLGFILWICHGNKAYYHLASYTPNGYQQYASFALFWHSIQYFRQHGFDQLSLGAGAGLKEEESGLTRFKKGWSTSTLPVYFCSRICNRDVYHQLSSGIDTDFFPAYRKQQ